MEKIKKIRKDIVSMSVFLAGGLCFAIWIIPAQIPVRGNQGAQAFTSRTFPYIITYSICVVAVLGLLSTILQYRKLRSDPAMREKGDKGEQAFPVKSTMEILIPYIIFGLIVVYGVLFRSIGYIVATVIILPVMLFLLGCRKWMHYVCAGLFAAMVYVVFKILLLVPLP